MIPQKPQIVEPSFALKNALGSHSISRELIGVTLLQAADYRLRPERASLLLADTVFDLPWDLLNQYPSTNLLPKFDAL
ncbi:uncharacterized protein PFLUO_LOCUS4735 [Penicillium psychrofluorescens]|uniref:uncharacterized protein n=1 Tax=Penicillium psychrofluorescens TaxID=3158075 RepID=UPI003CCE1371